MNPDQIQKYIDLIVGGVMNYAPKVLAAILILWIGMKVLGRVSKVIRLLIEKSGLSPEISGFVSGLVDIILKGILLLVVAGIVGVDTTSFVALIAAMGFAIGLALQGSLANFASGILILIFKPYKVGDYIEVVEKFGKVIEIQILNTVLESPGNKTHVIPNAKVMDDVVTNISTKGNIRIEMEVSMPYSEDYNRVEGVLMEVLTNHPNVLNDPKPEVGILSYDSHSILLAVRPYVLPEEYWEVRFEVMAMVKKAFHENNIQVAYSEGVAIGQVGA